MRMYIVISLLTLLIFFAFGLIQYESLGGTTTLKLQKAEGKISENLSLLSKEIDGAKTSLYECKKLFAKEDK